MDRKNIENNQTYTDQLDWLMESATPSIRFLTLTTLMGKTSEDPQVKKLKAEIPNSEPVHSILNEQLPSGGWIWERSHYGPKYRASHWTMLLLSELGVDGMHPQMQKGAEYMLARMQPEIHKTRSEDEIGFGCFWANLLRYVLHCGKLDDPRVAEVVHIVQKDIERRGQCAYNWDLPCAWAVIRDLWALALIPENQRSGEIKETIEHGIHFVLDDAYDLSKGNYPYREKIHPLWTRLSFPLFYQTDILFTLRMLKELDALSHPKAQAALFWLRGKQGKNGRWKGSSPFKSKTWPFAIEEEGTSRWITLQALAVLQNGNGA